MSHQTRPSSTWLDPRLQTYGSSATPESMLSVGRTCPTSRPIYRGTLSKIKLSLRYRLHLVEKTCTRKLLVIFYLACWLVVRCVRSAGKPRPFNGPRPGRSPSFGVLASAGLRPARGPALAWRLRALHALRLPSTSLSRVHAARVLRARRRKKVPVEGRRTAYKGKSPRGYPASRRPTLREL